MQLFVITILFKSNNNAVYMNLGQKFPKEFFRLYKHRFKLMF